MEDIIKYTWYYLHWLQVQQCIYYRIPSIVWHLSILSSFIFTYASSQNKGNKIWKNCIYIYYVYNWRVEVFSFISTNNGQIHQKQLSRERLIELLTYLGVVVNKRHVHFVSCKEAFRVLTPINVIQTICLVVVPINQTICLKAGTSTKASLFTESICCGSP